MEGGAEGDAVGRFLARQAEVDEHSGVPECSRMWRKRLVMARIECCEIMKRLLHIFTT